MLSVDGDTDAAVENRIRIEWNSMSHGSETWPVREKNEVALQWAEMRMVRWMCGLKLQERIPSKGLRD